MLLRQPKFRFDIEPKLFSLHGSATGMARESFLLRTDPKVLAALRRWADDEFRSANAQLDFLLRKALKDAGRSPGTTESSTKDTPAGPVGEIEEPGE